MGFLVTFMAERLQLLGVYGFELYHDQETE